MKKYEIIAESLQRWIQEQLQQRGHQQWMDKGIKLPAVRVLAEQYQCSVSTAIRAYQWLEKQQKEYDVTKKG